MADDDPNAESPHGDASGSNHALDAKKLHSPFVSEVLSRLGTALDSAGKAMVGFAGLDNIFHSGHLQFTGAQLCVGLLGCGLVLFAVYLQGEAKR